MKNNKNGYVKGSLLAILFVIGGLSLLIAPERVSDLVIRGIGFVWILEGIIHGLGIMKTP